jgi:GNAT superfamily N-acetyltransferase
VTIRPARPDDALALADLTTQLGYLTSATELAERLAPLLVAPDHLVLVATGDDKWPVGWIHVTVEVGLEHAPTASIHGLVVDEGHRSDGIGATLLAAGERWATEHGLGSMVVRSRVARERAHRFYEREGYRLEKTSRVFSKTLPPGGEERIGAAEAATRSNDAASR